MFRELAIAGMILAAVILPVAGLLLAIKIGVVR